ncbi:hypothetical protein ACHHYP_15011 [Achlya hypogyna]|uniref:Uncharacterized protein n=1 Tax=Achlya hypogyna TaxID=1202772 RepID=A0A1V9YBS4_ACHHY|nr:hypothetical protein ACHHYP_15011 [Achlya hypogyna]
MSVYVKGGVGRQYTISTTFADVRERLDAAFNTISSDVIYNCIENSKAEVRRLNAYIRDSETADDDDGGGEDCGSECDGEESGDECDLSDFDVDISPLDDDINTIA